MKAFVRQSQGRLLRVTVPPFPLTAIAGQLYSPANVVQWDPAYEPDVFVAELDAEAAADATTLDVVEWPAGARPPRAGDPVFLAAAVEPGSHPIEPFTVDYVDGTTVAIRGGRLRFTWAAGSKLYLRYVDVPLVAVDLAETGRGWRVELSLTLADGTEDLASQVFDIVKRVPENKLTEAELQERYPATFHELGLLASQTRGGLPGLIRRAFEDVVQRVHQTVNADWIYSDEELIPVLIAYVRVLLARDRQLRREETDRERVIDHEMKAYDAAFDSFLAAIGWLDRNENQKPDEGEVRASAVRRVLMEY